MKKTIAAAICVLGFVPAPQDALTPSVVRPTADFDEDDVAETGAVPLADPADLVPAAAVPLSASAFTVSSTATDRVGTLRQAILQANASPGLDLIDRPPRMPAPAKNAGFAGLSPSVKCRICPFVQGGSSNG